MSLWVPFSCFKLERWAQVQNTEPNSLVVSKLQRSVSSLWLVPPFLLTRHLLHTLHLGTLDVCMLSSDGISLRIDSLCVNIP